MCVCVFVILYVRCRYVDLHELVISCSIVVSCSCIFWIYLAYVLASRRCGLQKLCLFGRQHAPMRQIAMVRRVFDGLMVILWPRVGNHGKPLVTLYPAWNQLLPRKVLRNVRKLRYQNSGKKTPMKIEASSLLGWVTLTHASPGHVCDVLSLSCSRRRLGLQEILRCCLQPRSGSNRQTRERERE